MTPLTLTTDFSALAHMRPALDVAADGRVWVAWLVHDGGAERVVARCRDGDKLGEVHAVSTVSGAEGAPSVACLSDGCVWVVWCAWRDGRCTALGRRYSGAGWGEEVCLSSADEQPLQAVAAALPASAALAVWSALDDHSLRLRSALWHNGSWSSAENLAPTEPDAFSGFRRGENGSRPCVCEAADGSVWCVWDQYAGACYTVWASQWSGRWSAAERLTSGPDWEFCPNIAVANDGTPFAAWLHLTDVQNAEGVIDQWATVRCARRQPDGWQPCGDDEHGTCADLAHGLLPKGAVWGYPGRRRQPLLLPDEAKGMWLVWERKEEHDQPTTQSVGVLCGRHFDGSAWSEPVELRRGYYWYVLPSRPVGREVPFAGVLCSGPDRLALVLDALELRPPSEYPPLRTETWTGWQGVQLVCNEPRPVERPRIRAAGQEYGLYWGDPHCHSTLSGDAEGEPDELLRYARDKAGLDFVALTDNDFYEAPLLEGDWHLYQTLAAHLEDEGFAILPGYEWSYRTPRDRPDRAPDVPDHRSVLYPDFGRGVLRYTDEPGADTERLAAFVTAQGGILHAHHGKWYLTQSECERNAEACSAWQVYIEEYDTIAQALAAGRRIGLIGGSDSHRRNPGLCGALTGVWATGPTRREIFEGLRARRCYATDGCRIQLDLRIDGAPMGSEIQSARWPEISVSAAALADRVGGAELPRPIVCVEVLRNGVPLRVERPNGATCSFAFTDRTAPPGVSYYQAVVSLQGQRLKLPSNVAPAEGFRAWSSPVWVRRI